MPHIIEQVAVNATVHDAYRHWSRFEWLPRFAGSVVDVHHRDNGATHWTVRIAGVTREFDAETLQVPDSRITWRSPDGPVPHGTVTFEPRDERTTTVTVSMALRPRGPAEILAAGTSLISHRVKRDLRRFKDYLESYRFNPYHRWLRQLRELPVPEPMDPLPPALIDEAPGDRRRSPNG